MSIQEIAKQLKIDKIPFVTPIYRNIQDYWAVNHNREVVIDICTVCKSNCVYCLHQREKLIKPQIMSYDVFHQIIAILCQEHIKKIHIFQSGEPFLHPKIYDMIFLSRIAGINITIGTRLNAVIDFSELDSVASSSKNITIEFLITIDSITKMNEISPGMNKRLIINNIQQLSQLLKYKNVKFTFESVITRINESTIYEARDFLRSYGFNNWHIESMAYYMWKLAPQSELDMISKLITINGKYHDRFNIVNGEVVTKRNCNGIIPTISPDGDVSICCHDMLHTINAGNILEVGSLNKIIHSEKHHKLKKLGLNKQLEICKSCN